MSIDDPITVVFLALSAANVLFMQAGFSMLETGLVRAKNSKSILFKTMAGFTIGVIVWWLFGFGLAGNGASGQEESAYASEWSDFSQISFIHSLSFATASCTIISGAVTERMRFHAYLFFSLINIGVIYPLISLWCWSHEGRLFKLGFKDFAGSGVVHLCGGISALVGSWILGPRSYRFTRASGRLIEVNEMPGNSPVISSIGVYILVFGWLSFNASSTLSADMHSMRLATRAMSNTILSGAISGCFGVIINQLVHKTHDLAAFHNSFLSGMVGITASSAYVSSSSAILIGIISSVINIVTSQLVLKFQIDDVVDAFSVHGSPGLWGLLAVAIFSPDGCIELFWIQCLGGLVIILWSGGITGLVFYLLKSFNWLRVSLDEELLGLDFMDHEGGAWPEYSHTKLQEAKDYRLAERRLVDRGDVKKRRRVTCIEFPGWSKKNVLNLKDCMPWFKHHPKITPTDNRLSIVVIGSGVIGLSIAHSLSTAYKVTVIDKNDFQNGSSYHGGGLLSSVSIESEKRLCEVSLELHATMNVTLNGALNYGYRQVSVYSIRPSKDEVCQNSFDDISWIDRMIDFTVTRVDSASSFIQVHPRLFTQTIKRKAEENNCKFIHAEVINIEKNEQQKVTGVRLSKEIDGNMVIPCDLAVIATASIPSNLYSKTSHEPKCVQQTCTCRVFHKPSLVSDGCAIGSTLPPSAIFAEFEDSTHLVLHIQANGNILVCNVGDADDASVLVKLRKLSSVFESDYELQGKCDCKMSILSDHLPIMCELDRGLYACVGFGYCGFELAPTAQMLMKKLIDDRLRQFKVLRELEEAYGIDFSRFSIDRFH